MLDADWAGESMGDAETELATVEGDESVGMFLLVAGLLERAVVVAMFAGDWSEVIAMAEAGVRSRYEQKVARWWGKEGGSTRSYKCWDAGGWLLRVPKGSWSRAAEGPMPRARREIGRPIEGRSEWVAAGLKGTPKGGVDATMAVWWTLVAPLSSERPGVLNNCSTKLDHSKVATRCAGTFTASAQSPPGKTGR